MEGPWTTAQVAPQKPPPKKTWGNRSKRVNAGSAFCGWEVPAHGLWLRSVGVEGPENVQAIWLTSEVAKARFSSVTPEECRVEAGHTTLQHLCCWAWASISWGRPFFVELDNQIWLPLSHWWPRKTATPLLGVELCPRRISSACAKLGAEL